MVLQAPRSHVSSYITGASHFRLCSDLWFLADASYLRHRIVENNSLIPGFRSQKDHAGERSAQPVLFTQWGTPQPTSSSPQITLQDPQ